MASISVRSFLSDWWKGITLLDDKNDFDMQKIWLRALHLYNVNMCSLGACRYIS